MEPGKRSTVSQRQQRILSDIIPALKEGGLLVYSTCSFSKQENEDICDWAMQHHPLSSLSCHLEENWHIVESASDVASAFGYRFYPEKLIGEGFFIAALRKERHVNSRREEGKIRKSPDRLSKGEVEVIKPWIKNPGEFFYIRQHDEVIALPIQVEKNLPELQSALYLKKAGIKLGSIIRNELIPAHELALSTIRNDSIPFIEVDKQTALQYLRRQNMDLQPELKGWALITYNHVPLGWVKVLAGRINNYYPKEWRILNK
jgi:NOL1/NOP2/fmu family ribosome biogenesis protein